MHKLAILIKTYKQDFELAKILINSINKHNIDKIPVYISINDEDFDFFKNKLITNHTLLKDSDIYKSNVKDGWRYQQIIKTQLKRMDDTDEQQEFAFVISALNLEQIDGFKSDLTSSYPNISISVLDLKAY